MVTADALDCNRRTVATVNAGGGDRCIALKGNLESLLSDARGCFLQARGRMVPSRHRGDRRWRQPHAAQSIKHSTHWQVIMKASTIIVAQGADGINLPTQAALRDIPGPLQPVSVIEMLRRSFAEPVTHACCSDPSRSASSMRAEAILEL